MRILHIINSLATGGAEKLIVETIPLYAEQGLTADVLLLNGTRYPLYDELEAVKCTTIYSLGTGSVYNPAHIGKIIPFLKKYDLIHVHLFPAQYFAIAAKRLSFSKKPFVFTEHSTSNRRFSNKKYKLADRIIYNSYNRIVCITDKVKAAVAQQTGMRVEKLPVIENGINLATINNAQSYSRAALSSYLTLNLSEKDYLIMQVSSFQEPKDQPTVIHSLQHLAKHVKLLLAGDGILKQNCEALVQELGLENRVFFLGLRQDIPSLLKSVDVIVLSSKYEGLSLSSIEGMASGKPFIASDVPGLSEVVGGAGILFALGDDHQLAAEIMKLLNNKDHYAEVSRKCQERARQYDINKMVDQHIELYKKLVSK